MRANRQAGVSETVSKVDPIWECVLQEAQAAVVADNVVAPFLYSTILSRPSLEASVIYRICARLDHPDVPADFLCNAFFDMLADWSEWGSVLRVDIQAFYDRDPACTRFLEPILYYKGFHAIQTHRLAYWLLKKGRRDFALYLQSRSSSIFQTDINPAAHFGKGIFLDHATGFVVGETARIGDNVSVLHSVTLGGTGKSSGDRHPKIEDCVLIGAGAKVLGNITVGRGSRIAAGSVVLKDVASGLTVAGVPAQIVGNAGCNEPARTMDQLIADT